MQNESQVNIVRGTICSLHEYKLGSDWWTYQERLGQYFLANYIPDDRQVAVLLTLININEELNDLEKRGVISLTDYSEWGSPLVPVVKETGKIRICADYKITVNKYLLDMKHPVPWIEDLFAALQGSECFTKLGSKNAYSQLELSEDTKKLLCWSTHRGIYQLNRLPYGTKPACSIFQKIVEKVLIGIPGVINFLDDIVVMGKNRKEHLQNMEVVFHWLESSDFKLNLKKYVPRPQNVLEVRAYVGMINYYGRFIKFVRTIL